MNERIAWIDWAKAIGILMVIYAHVPDAPFGQIFSLFRMPFFFMLSGFLYKPRHIKDEIRRLSYCLVIPYLLYNGVLLALTPPQDISQGILDVLLGNQERLPSNYHAMWFLVSIMVMRLTSSVFVRNLWSVAIVTLILFVFLKFLGRVDGDCDYFQLNTTLLCFQYFIFGFYLKKKPEICILNKYSKAFNYIVISIGFLFFLFVGNHYVGNVNLFRCDTGNSLLCFLVVSYSLSYLLLRLFQLAFTGESSVVRNISNGTLLLLCTHQTLIYLIRVLEIKTGCILIPVAIPFVLIMVSYFPIIVCERYFPILIGKRPKIL